MLRRMILNICTAVNLRIKKLLIEKDISLYRLEQTSGILHGTMMCIVKEKNKNVTLKTVMQLARGFDMTVLEFLDDEVFLNQDIEID